MINLHLNTGGTAKETKPVECTPVPCNGRILVKFTAATRERMTDSGLHVPDTVGDREKLVQAQVVGVADDVPQFKRGDVVMVHHNEGFDIRAADLCTVLRVLPATGVYVVLRPVPPPPKAAEPAVIDCAAGASPLTAE